MPTFHFIQERSIHVSIKEGISLGHPLANSGTTPKAWYSPNQTSRLFKERALYDRRLEEMLTRRNCATTP